MCQNVQQQCLLVELEVVSGCTLAQSTCSWGREHPIVLYILGKTHYYYVDTTVTLSCNHAHMCMEYMATYMYDHVATLCLFKKNYKD